jgi:dTDP-4-dehydrorhamnose reductase
MLKRKPTEGVQNVKCLLTGGSGLMGMELLQQLPLEWDVSVTLHPMEEQPPWRRNIRPLILDLTDRKGVAAAVQSVKPDVVVHAASLGDLDACERRKTEARQINVQATRWLLETTQPYDPMFVFLSSMYVFDGRNPPYDEEATPNPLGTYGRTKLEAEHAVLELSARPIILRPMTLYGWHLPYQRTNCVTWLLHRLSKGEPLKIVDDVLNNCMWVGDVARALLAAVQHEACGTFHLGGPEALSRYEMSRIAAEVFGFDKSMISPVSSEYFPSLAPRPRNATCTIDKMKRVLGVVPLNPEQGFQVMRDRIPDWADVPASWSQSGMERMAK